MSGVARTVGALARFALAAAATAGLLGLPSVVAGWPSLGLDPAIDARVRYQLLALALAGIVVVVNVASGPSGRRFSRLGQLDAPVAPAPAIGLRPKPGETWRHVGRNFAVVLPVVTAVAVGVQVVAGHPLTVGAVGAALPWAVGLSVSNAIVEESICRFGVVVALIDRFGPRVAVGASAALFGGVHWFGTPGHVLGVVLAGFLGWLLAKSLVETGGMGWALLLHALVDVPIFTAQLAVER